MPKKKKINIAVIFGGQSGEHEVSLLSALSIIKNLNPKKYRVIPIGIDKLGRWITGKSALELFPKKTQKLMPSSVDYRNTSSAVRVISLQKKSFLKNSLHVAFPVLHGTHGEDGAVQGLLELAHIPYVGAGVLGSALGMDKVAQKELYAYHGLTQANFVWFYKKNYTENKNKILKNILQKIHFPLFVKPANLGSSVGITKAKNINELKKAIWHAGQYDEKILVEEGVRNIREIECSVLGNENPVASLPGEVIPSNEFYDYNAKYIDNKSKLIIPAKLPKKVIKKIQELSIRAFQILNLSGMARVDFFVKKNNNLIFINEVNTIPGFTAISMYPKLWEASGIPYSKLLDILVSLAIKRSRIKNRLKTSYKPE